MYFTLQTPTNCSLNPTMKNIKRNQRKQKPNRRNGKLNPLFQKPSPTPLLANRKQHPQSKLEALDAIVNDLEASVERGVKIDTQIFASLLESCFHLKAFDHGFRIHRLIPDNLRRRNVGLSSKLLRLYATAGRMEDAHQVFDEMSERNSSAFPWNSLISGYAEAGLHEDALAIYFQMEEGGVEPDRFTFPRVMKACAGIGSIILAEEIHRHVVRHGFGTDEFVLNSLIDMYAKCGDIVNARKVFDKIPLKDLVSWNSILNGYTLHDLQFEAMQIFKQMIEHKIDTDSISISSILTSLSSPELGAQIHAWIIRREIDNHLSIANSLIMFYSNYHKLEKARHLFDKMPERDIVSWNSIISAHSKNPKSLHYFKKMEISGVLPDEITFVSLLSACAHLKALKNGERLFLSMKEKYGLNPKMEHYACMVNLYGRAGLIEQAYRLIVDEMVEVEVVAGPTVWGSLLYACFVHGNVGIGEIAGERLFELEPENEHNYELLMRIYGNGGCLEGVERVRGMMVERGMEF